MTHLSTVTLTTNRLILRPLSFADADVMFENWTQDPLVVKHLSWKPHLSLDETKRIVSYWMSNYPDPKFYLWGIQLKTGKLIGTISIHTIHDAFQRAEIGYALMRSMWGQGYATEAVHAVLAFGFEKVGFNRLEAYYALANEASGRVLVKAGMRKEGVLRQYYRSNVGFEDVQLCGILRLDWERLNH
jgi:ribosomal-protein-alanine N-acetyltransferase